MATSNADFYRAQFANMNNEDRQRKNALQDDFTKSQYDLGTAQIPAIQNDPSLSPEEKASRINTIRQQGFKIMNAGMAKAELAKAMQRFGITDTSGPQSVPAEQPLTLSAQPQPQNQQVPFTPQEIAEGGGAVAAPSPEAMKVQPEAMSGVESLTPAPVTLPGREAQHVAQAPTPINEALASSHAGQFVPITLSDGSRMMVPVAQAMKLLPTQERNAAAAERNHDTLDSRESIQNANRDSRESIATDRANKPPVLGSLGDFITRVATQNGVDTRELSPETVLGLNHAYYSSKQSERVSQGHYIYTDTSTGNVVDIPITRRSTPVAAPMPAIPNSKFSTSPAAQPPAAKPAPTPVAAKHQAAAIAGAPAAPGVGQPAAPMTGKVIGHKASVYDQAALKGGTKAVDTVRPMVNIDQTMSQYIKSGQYSPRQDLALIVSAVRAMNPGTVRLPQTELALEIKAGSWTDRMRRSWEMASNGTLPPDQRQDLYRIVHHETAVSAANAMRELQAAGGQVPPFLQAYGAEGNPEEQIQFTVDGQHPVRGTRQQMEAIEAAGHKVLREQ